MLGCVCVCVCVCVEGGVPGKLFPLKGVFQWKGRWGGPLLLIRSRTGRTCCREFGSELTSCNCHPALLLNHHRQTLPALWDLILFSFSFLLQRKTTNKHLILATGKWDSGTPCSYSFQADNQLVAQTIKNLPSVQETQVQSLGLKGSPGEGNGSSVPHPCLENPMDRGAWRATVHRVAKSRTQLSDWTTIAWQ